MIIEERLLSIFEQLPEVGGFKPVYHFGDDLEFNKFILKSTKSVYPLIWQLVKPEKDNFHKHSNTTDLELIIATRNLETDMLNTTRWETSYKNVLNPVYENVKTGLIRSGIIRSEWEFDKLKSPNYSQVDNGDKNKTIDIIDVIVLKLNGAVFTNDCVRQIKF